MARDNDNDTETRYSDEQEDEHETESWAKRAGKRVGTVFAKPFVALFGFIFNTVRTFALNLTSVVPGGHIFWRRICEFTLHAYYKSSGADAINISYRANGGVIPIPVKWKAGEDMEEKWVSKDGEQKWTPSVRGSEVDYFGSKFKTPVVLSTEDAPRTESAIGVELAECVEHDKERMLFDEVLVQETDVYVPESPAGGAGEAGAAVADGGVAQNPENWVVDESDAEIAEVGEWKDTLVDLSVPDWADGRVASVRNYYEMAWEKTGTEEMEWQKQMGMNAEQDKGKWRRWALKIMLIAGAVAVGAFVLVFLILSQSGALSNTGLMVGV
jgi:hypothetical protein